MGWITPHRDELLRKHGHKYTAAQFASAWDTTRNAVLGRAHRLGISLRKGEAKVASGPRRLRGHPMKVRAAAVAAVMAGAGYQRAADLAGVSIYSSWTWSRNPKCVAAGRALYERAVCLAKVGAA